MDIEKAYRILNKNREFLGMDWYSYFRFIKRSPSSFSPRVVKAYERYINHHIC